MKYIFGTERSRASFPLSLQAIATRDVGTVKGSVLPFYCEQEAPGSAPSCQHHLGNPKIQGF